MSLFFNNNLINIIQHKLINRKHLSPKIINYQVNNSSLKILIEINLLTNQKLLIIVTKLKDK